MDPQAVLDVIDDSLPRILAGLYLVEIISMFAFGIIAWVMGAIHHGKFDLYRILRNGLGGGAAFPPSMLLILYPVSMRAQHLFGAEALKVYLMVAGATGAVLSLYGVFKK
jgi:hypothetical protein